MKLKHVFYFVLASGIILFTSCSKKNAKVPVPKDAGLVMHIDGASLNSKLSWDDIKQSEWHKMIAEEVKDDMAKKLLDNPEASGIDIKSDAYFFMKMEGSHAYNVFTCGIKDEKAFAAFIARATENKAVEKKDDLSVINIDETVLTWSENRFVLLTSSPAPSFGGDDNYQRRKTVSSDSLVRFAAKIYHLDSDESLGSDDRFEKMMDQKGDLHIWMDAGNMYGGKMPAIFSMTQMTSLYKGNATGATLNFEDGKITIDAKSYYNKELAALYKKYSGHKLDESVLKKIPSSNVVAAMAMNYPPEGLQEFIKLMGLDGFLNLFLAKIEFSMDDFVKANKGDVMLAVSDFSFGEKEIKLEMGEKDFSYKRKMPEAKFLFATSIGNKISFEKMVDVLKGKMTEEGKMAEDIAGKLSYQMLEDWFVAGNDSAQVQAFSTANTNHPFISRISGHPMGGFLDIQKIISGLRPSLEDSSMLKIADMSASFWQDIIVYGGEFNDNATDSHVEINLVDKKNNSLKQLSNYLGNMAMLMQAREKRSEEEWREEVKADTLRAPAAE